MKNMKQWFKPEIVEFYFDLDATLLVLALHRVVKEVENAYYVKITNILIERTSSERALNSIYSLIVVKSVQRHTKESLINMLGKFLPANKSRGSTEK